MKQKPVTLADLRRAAPEGSRIREYFPKYFAPSGRCWWIDVEQIEQSERLVEVSIHHRSRQTARRAALAALKEIAR